MLTNANGTVVANYTFDAYGNQSEENTVYNPFGYRGEYTDKDYERGSGEGDVHSDP